MILTGIIIIIAFYLLYATMAKLIDPCQNEKELKRKEKILKELKEEPEDEQRN